MKQSPIIWITSFYVLSHIYSSTMKIWLFALPENTFTLYQYWSQSIFNELATQLLCMKDDCWNLVIIQAQSMHIFIFSSRRRHTRYWRNWSSDVCSSALKEKPSLQSFKACIRGKNLADFIMDDNCNSCIMNNS